MTVQYAKQMGIQVCCIKRPCIEASKSARFLAVDVRFFICIENEFSQFYVALSSSLWYNMRTVF